MNAAQPIRWYKATLAYDGTDFAGWQWQPNQRTVQGELQKAMLTITGQHVHCVCSGRTDAGVHALGQVASFASPTHYSCDDLRRRLHGMLPEDIVVFDVVEAPEDFHAIRDAVRKRYRYVLQDGRVPDIFARKYVWHIRDSLDSAAMHIAGQALVGKHDYKSYQTSGSSRLTTVRTIHELVVRRYEAELTSRVLIEVEADGFLYNMVRNIAGTLMQVGRGRQPIEWPAEVLKLRDRRRAGMTAPPQGLYLIGVDYGDLFERNAAAQDNATPVDGEALDQSAIRNPQSTI